MLTIIIGMRWHALVCVGMRQYSKQISVEAPQFNMKFYLLVVICVAVCCAYDESIAKRMIIYSAISYCGPHRIQNWNCPDCSKVPYLLDLTVITEDSHHVQGYLGVDHTNSLILGSFRGVGITTLKQWKSYFQLGVYMYQRCTACKVPTGFIHLYLSIKDALYQTFSQLLIKYPSYSVMLTGHGVGGAIASYFQIDLLLDFNARIAGVYTFGSPRIGDGAFRKWFLETIASRVSTFTVTHARDPIPHFPLHIIFMHKYFRPPQEVFYQGKLGEHFILCEDEKAQDPKCSNHFTFSYQLADHKVYLDYNIYQAKKACQDR